VRKIEAIIRGEKQERVCAALKEAGIAKWTMMKILEYNSIGEHKEIYRSSFYNVESLPKLKIEVIVPQNKVSQVVALLKKQGQAGNGGEERICISSVNDVGRSFLSGKGESV
jgi:nitrogen regulatory protein P-II 1